MKLLELHEHTNPLQRQVSFENIGSFYFFSRFIEALTACTGAVGHSSPTVVGEGLVALEDDSNNVMLKVHDSSVFSFIPFFQVCFNISWSNAYLYASFVMFYQSVVIKSILKSNAGLS